MKLRLQPIRVYCLHHVCEQFDPESMNECDWMPIDEFKRKVLSLKAGETAKRRNGKMVKGRGVEFISLAEAYRHICKDWFRWKKFAVITFDDGYASLKEILPWLNEQKMPVTLFVNPDYAAGKAFRETSKEQYLTIEELSELAQTPNTKHHTPKVEIGMHGLQHVDVSKMSEVEFQIFAEESIVKTQSIASRLSPLAYIPFWAYTWGHHNPMTDKVLKENGIVPVLMDGMKNYNDPNCIHRELLEKA